MKNLKKIFAVAMSIATVAMSTSAFAQPGVSKAKYADGVASLTVDALLDPTFKADKQMTVVIVPKNLGEITAADIQYINQDEAAGFTTILAGMGTKDTINPADYEVRVGGTDITDVWVFSFEEAVKLVYGDVNDDTYITITDANDIMRSLINEITLSDTQKKVADVNADTYITITDANDIMRYLINEITEFDASK